MFLNCKYTSINRVIAVNDPGGILFSFVTIFPIASLFNQERDKKAQLYLFFFSESTNYEKKNCSLNMTVVICISSNEC